MNSKKHTARMQRFEALCREQDLSLTVQRRVIFQTVLERDDHPTADQVYELAKGRIPGLSRTTVYRVLDTLVHIGAITKVCHPGAAARFDPKVHRHHHLVCLQCDSIIDLEDARLNEIKLPRISTRGFEVHDFHLQLRGVCRKCRENLSKAGHPMRKPGKRSVRTSARIKGKRRSRKGE
jgi:Fur family peroxide stress response transcriptional regulator